MWQRCLLSPYLFVICMHVLSRKLDKAAMERKFGYHPSCQGVRLTHLCFSDDVLVFYDGKQWSVEAILETFTQFAAVSGLGISTEKSTIFMAGVQESDRQTILDQLAFASGSLPVWYLGLPMMTKQMKVTDYTPQLEKISARIMSCNARFLSFACSLKLISSVVHSLVNFWISAFRLPKRGIYVTKERNFWSVFERKTAYAQHSYGRALN